MAREQSEEFSSKCVEMDFVRLPLRSAFCDDHGGVRIAKANSVSRTEP